ncbi:MAG TPA: sulfate ABC transporter permease subunit CysT [Symbiobacteriaceae bacterium]
MAFRQRGPLPGFGLTLGFTLAYLSVLVLLPLSTLLLKTATLTWERFWQIVTDSRVLAALRLSFGAALAAAGVNAVFGLLVAWVLERYDFPGRRLVDALVDLPFALPTAVGGLALTHVFGPSGWIGRYLAEMGIRATFTPLGVIIALVFIGLPFVVRSVQPLLQDLDPQVEEAAALLGATPLQTFWRVILPTLAPGVLTGFALALARGLGEYGSVTFISGNLPFRTEVAPLLIMAKLEQFDYAGATAIAVVMLAASFLLLMAVNLLQWWSMRHNLSQGG